MDVCGRAWRVEGPRDGWESWRASARGPATGPGRARTFFAPFSKKSLAAILPFPKSGCNLGTFRCEQTPARKDGAPSASVQFALTTAQSRRTGDGVAGRHCAARRYAFDGRLAERARHPSVQLAPVTAQKVWESPAATITPWSWPTAGALWRADAARPPQHAPQVEGVGARAARGPDAARDGGHMRRRRACGSRMSAAS